MAGVMTTILLLALAGTGIFMVLCAVSGP